MREENQTKTFSLRILKSLCPETSTKNAKNSISGCAGGPARLTRTPTLSFRRHGRDCRPMLGPPDRPGGDKPNYEFSRGDSTTVYSKEYFDDGKKTGWVYAAYS
jgi:hypothetical protein